MSSGMVSKAKIGLQAKRQGLKKPLITVAEEVNKNGGKPNHSITIADIWNENMNYFASSCSELDSPTSSPDEVASSHSERASSPREVTSSLGEIRKEPFRKERKEEEEVTAHTRLMKFLSLKIGPIPNGPKEGKAIKWLLENGYDVDQCQRCFESLAAEEWRTSTVSWVTVKANIGAWLARNGNGSKSPKTASDRNVNNMKDSLAYLDSLADKPSQLTS